MDLQTNRAIMHEGWIEAMNMIRVLMNVQVHTELNILIHLTFSHDVLLSLSLSLKISFHLQRRAKSTESRQCAFDYREAHDGIAPILYMALYLAAGLTANCLNQCITYSPDVFSPFFIIHSVSSSLL